MDIRIIRIEFLQLYFYFLMLLGCRAYIYFCFQLTTCSPPVLVPGFDLRVGQVERCCQLHSVLHAQVLLTLKTALQLGELMVSEGGPRFPWLLQANLRAVSAARDLPVALLFH